MTIQQRLHILHLSDGNRGGSQRHIVDLCRSDSSGLRHFVFRVTSESIGLFDVEGDRVLTLDAGRLAHGWPSLVRTLIDELGIGCVHAHALAPLVELLDAQDPPLAIKYCVTLHDLRCIDPAFFDAPRTVPVADPAWIARCALFLEKAGAVIVPSEWLAAIVRAHYPGLTPQVIENGIDAPPAVELTVALPWTGKRVYAVVGALGPHKGSQTLAQVANAISDPDIAGVLIGYTDAQKEPGWLVPGKLYAHGRYRQDELHGLLRAYRCRLAYFPNIVPESFSYVLSEVWQAGLPALVPDIGALGERMKATGAGWLLDDPLDATAAATMIGSLLAPHGSAQLSAAASRLAAPGHMVPDLAVTRPQVEDLYHSLGSVSPRNADAGWTRIAYQTRTAQFAGIDDSFLDAQWPALVREENSLRGWNAKLVQDISALGANAQRMQSHFEECVIRARQLDADVRQLKERNERIEADAAALRTRSDALETHYDVVAARNGELEAAVAAIRTRNSDLEQHVVALRERNLRVEADVITLIGRNAQLEGDVVALTQRNIELDSDVVALKERNTLVEAGLAAIKLRNTRVELDAAALAAELENTHKRLASGNAREAELRRALDVLPSTVQTWLLRHAR